MYYLEDAPLHPIKNTIIFDFTLKDHPMPKVMMSTEIPYMT